MQTLKVIPLKRPFTRVPYLNKKVNISFTLPDDHFLVKLGYFNEKEIIFNQKENEEADKKPISEKIKDGELLESVTIVGFENREILVDISNVKCNIGVGHAIHLMDLKKKSRYNGTINISDGEKLSIEAWMDVELGDRLRIQRHHSAFNNWMDGGIDHYYRFLRTQENVELVEKKLNGFVDSLMIEIPEIKSLGNLDTFQIAAFNECISSNPVTLVQGPHGTGKTTFAAHLCNYLLERGFEVMVTAFTHDAVNNILERILELKGSVTKIGKKNKSTEQLEPFRKEKFSTGGKCDSIIGMTIHSLLKNHKKFDFIIVDEASQMDIVSGVHFLASSAKTIFVGDHMQLPNISKIPDTEFSISIFDLLMKTYKPTSLLTTYRFNQSICDYISPNFYEGRLICCEKVKDNYLKLQSSEFIINSQLSQAMTEEALIFIHTEEEVEFLLNKEHANITADLIADLLKLGVLKKEIGVIAPNNMQVNFIKKVLGARRIDRKDIQIETVNKFQGQEKDVIIYSSVITMTDSKKAKYDFFFDIRRFNVAVSRAKKKVIVLGNKDLFASAASFSDRGEKVADYLNKAVLLSTISSN